MSCCSSIDRGEHEPSDLPEAEHLHVDRTELSTERDAVDAFGPQAVVDLSAMTGADARAALRVFDGDLRLLVASSMDVYRAFGSVWKGTVTDPVPLTEESPLRSEPPPDMTAEPPPGWDFDFASYEKIEVEDAYRARGGTVCRLPMVYGEYDYKRREEFVLRRVRAGRSAIPVGVGNWLWSRAYVREVARGMRLALECDGAIGEVFNLAEASCTPVRVWIEEMLSAAGHEAELVRVPDGALPEEMEIAGAVGQHLLADTSKAREALGWLHSDPAEAVRKSVHWHLKNPPEDADSDFSADEAALAAAVSRG